MNEHTEILALADILNFGIDRSRDSREMVGEHLTFRCAHAY